MSNMRGHRGGASTPPTHRLGRAGLTTRLLVSGVTVVLAALGTLVGNDHWWPYSPMSQYAFGVPNDGVINSFYMDGVRADGTTGQVALSKEGIGLERSEMEGQLPRFQADPSLMQTIAVLQQRRRPELSPLLKIHLRNRQTSLGQGRTQKIITLASWKVLQPQDPERGLSTLESRR